MPSDWMTKSLTEVIALQRGHDLPAQDRVPGNVPIVGSFGITGTHSVARYDGPGVMIGRSGSIGNATFSPGPYWPLNTSLFVSDFRGNDPRWVYWLLHSIDFTNFNSGSVQPSLNRNYLTKIPVRLPPVAEQQRIAGFLESFDSLIESNAIQRRRAELLGSAFFELAILGAGGYRVLVPDEGWTRTTVGEVAAVIESGKRPIGGARGILEGVPSVGAESIGGVGVFDFSKTKYVPASFAENMRRGRVQNKDVLVYKDGGKPGDFRPHVGMLGGGFPFESFVINEHVYRVRVDQRLTQEYLYFWLSSDPMMDAMARAGTGAAIPGLNSTAFRGLPIMVPPKPALMRVQAVLAPLVDTCLSLAIEIEQLRRTRDELLPHLMSGKLRVWPEGVAA